MTEPAAATQSGWLASLTMEFQTLNARTVLGRRRHRGPLRVQRPFYPEGDVCHVYVLHPPGGVVGGDELRTEVVVQSSAAALLTTPAATRCTVAPSTPALLSNVFG
jgi:urease accessory protein